MTAPVLIHVATIEHVAMVDHVVSIDHVMTIATNETYRNFQTIRDYNQRENSYSLTSAFSHVARNFSIAIRVTRIPVIHVGFISREIESRIEESRLFTNALVAASRYANERVM